MKERKRTAAAAGAWALLLPMAAACVQDTPEPSGVAIGALVPFTGAAAAGGATYERAMLLAVEHLNESAASQRFRLVTRDTHSSVSRTLRGLEEIMNEDPIGLVGPEDVVLVKEVRGALGPRRVAQLLANSTTLADFAEETAGDLVRLAPPAEVMACALANRIYGDNHEQLVVVYAQDPYHEAFANSLVDAFQSYRFAAHVGSGAAFALSEGATGTNETISAALKLSPSAVVIAAGAAHGSSFVENWAALSSVQWFFDPTLGSDEFLRNVTQSTVNGGMGISLALPAEALEFEAVFRARWNGEQPPAEAHLYYDAVVSLGLASLAAQRGSGVQPAREDVASQVLRILRAPGKAVSWKQLAEAVQLVEAGSDIQYVGAAGRQTLDAIGRPDPASALTRFWTIQDGAIVPEKFGACPAGTLSP